MTNQLAKGPLCSTKHCHFSFEVELLAFSKSWLGNRWLVCQRRSGSYLSVGIRDWTVTVKIKFEVKVNKIFLINVKHETNILFIKSSKKTSIHILNPQSFVVSWLYACLCKSAVDQKLSSR
jgi:hypothetical protein